MGLGVGVLFRRRRWRMPAADYNRSRSSASAMNRDSLNDDRAITPGTETLDERVMSEQLLDHLAANGGQLLPLQAGCTQGGWADTNNLSLSMFALDVGKREIVAVVAAFYTEVVGGCNCHDDPVSYPVAARFGVRLSPAGEIIATEVLED
jgi:hypothetical protein